MKWAALGYATQICALPQGVELRTTDHIKGEGEAVGRGRGLSDVRMFAKVHDYIRF